MQPSLSPNRNDKQKKKKVFAATIGPACLPHNILRDTVRYHFQPESTRRQSFGALTFRALTFREDCSYGSVVSSCPTRGFSSDLRGEAPLIKPTIRALGTPLEWEEARHHADEVRDLGIQVRERKARLCSKPINGSDVLNGAL